jgi:hypothetical protein
MTLKKRKVLKCFKLDFGYAYMILNLVLNFMFLGISMPGVPLKLIC